MTFAIKVKLSLPYYSSESELDSTITYTIRFFLGAYSKVPNKFVEDPRSYMLVHMVLKKKYELN